MFESRHVYLSIYLSISLALSIYLSIYIYTNTQRFQRELPPQTVARAVTHAPQSCHAKARLWPRLDNLFQVRSTAVRVENVQEVRRVGGGAYMLTGVWCVGGVCVMGVWCVVCGVCVWWVCGGCVVCSVWWVCGWCVVGVWAYMRTGSRRRRQAATPASPRTLLTG